MTSKELIEARQDSYRTHPSCCRNCRHSDPSITMCLRIQDPDGLSKPFFVTGIGYCDLYESLGMPK